MSNLKPWLNKKTGESNRMNKKLNGYLIEKYSNMGKAYTCNRLVEEATLLGIELDIVGIHDAYVRKGGLYLQGEPLQTRDFAINRYKYGNLKQEIVGLTNRSYNKQEIFERYINKYVQVKNLQSPEFLIPNYILATSQAKFQILADELGLPFVAKGLESAQGEEVFLIHSEADLKSLIEKYGESKEILFEEFIQSSFGRDMRFYSIRGNVVAGMIRKSQGDFRANVALGAMVEACEVTPEIEKIAKSIYGQTGLDFLGIDLLFGKDKPYFCEINVMPGIEGIEQATKVNVARKIMETIRGDFDHE